MLCVFEGGLYSRALFLDVEVGDLEVLTEKLEGEAEQWLVLKESVRDWTGSWINSGDIKGEECPSLLGAITKAIDVLESGGCPGSISMLCGLPCWLRLTSALDAGYAKVCIGVCYSSRHRTSAALETSWYAAGR